MKKKTLTFEEHQAIGAELREMRNRLVQLSVKLGGVYPLKTRVLRETNRATYHIDLLRSILDDQIFKEFPEMDAHKLMGVYYGQGNDLGLTWEGLCLIEPRLEDLLKKVKAVKDPGGDRFCANTIWYRNFREELISLVGWEAKGKSPVLRTSQAYDLAYEKIYGVLPACRNCNCM